MPLAAPGLGVEGRRPGARLRAVNSPAMLADGPDLAGCTVVMRTTAGTVGARAVADAPLLLCASFVVADATARLLRSRAVAEATFVVTGDGGQADEDRACAELIARRVEDGAVEAAPYLGRARSSAAAADLAEGVRRGYAGVHPDDIELCLDADRFPFAMVAAPAGELLVLQPVAVAGGNDPEPPR